MKVCTTIPEQAVKAALDAFLNTARTTDGIKAALTAAAPHMRYKREFSISSCTVDLSGADYKRFLDGVTSFDVSLDGEMRSFAEYNEGDRVFLDVETGNLDAHNLFILSRPAFEKKVQERISALPHMSAIESSEHSIGWLYDSDDAGTEFSENHPIESGECSDAKNIKPATAENLRNELLISWKAWAEDREQLKRLRGEPTSETREHTFDAYMQIVEFFDKDKTAASFLREDGEGGFLSGIYRMAREVEKLRKEPSSAREEEAKDYEAIGQA